MVDTASAPQVRLHDLPETSQLPRGAMARGKALREGAPRRPEAMTDATKPINWIGFWLLVVPICAAIVVGLVEWFKEDWVNGLISAGIFLWFVTCVVLICL